MSRYSLPDDVRMEVIGYVRGYQRRSALVRKIYNDILEGSAAAYETYKIGEKEYRIYFPKSGEPGKPTEMKALALEKLNRTADMIRVRAVEESLVLIGEGIKNEEIRRELQKGIWKNCLSGRKYPYEKLGLTAISRKEFFRERRKFLWRIAKNAKLI